MLPPVNLSHWSPEAWAAVAAWVAAALTLAAAAWNAVNRERVTLVWHDGYVAHPEGATARVVLANAGRGTALAVRVSGRGCHAYFDRPLGNVFRQSTVPDRRVLPALQTGQSAVVVIFCAAERWSRAEV